MFPNIWYPDSSGVPEPADVWTPPYTHWIRIKILPISDVDLLKISFSLQKRLYFVLTSLFLNNINLIYTSKMSMVRPSIARNTYILVKFKICITYQQTIDIFCAMVEKMIWTTTKKIISRSLSQSPLFTKEFTLIQYMLTDVHTCLVLCYLPGLQIWVRWADSCTHAM